MENSVDESSSASRPSMDSASASLKRRATKHWTDDHFTDHPNGGYTCGFCGGHYKQSKDGSPGNLINHVKFQHPEEYEKYCPDKCKRVKKSDTAQDQIQNEEKKEDEEKFDREIYLEKLVKFLVATAQPYSIVDDKNFSDLIDYISKDRDGTKLPGRNDITARISKSFDEKKYAIAKKIQDAGSKVSLVIDCWTSGNQIPFQGVICRIIDRGWNLQTFPIDLTELHGPHSGENLAESLLEVLNEMDLVGKIVSITTDNAPNMGTFFRHFQNKMEELGIEFSMENQRVRCLAHIINLAVKCLIAVAEKYVPTQRLKEGIFSLRNGTSRREYYLRQCDIHKAKPLIPQLDCCPRWNSTYDLLDRALDIQKPLQSTFTGMEDLKKFALQPCEWEASRKLKEMLDPFKQATEKISVEKYPNIASNTMIFQYIFQYCNSFIDRAKSKSNGKNKQAQPDWAVEGMQKAKSKLEEFYADTDGKVYVIGTVLHPSFKLDWYREAKGWKPEWIEKCKKIVLDEWTANYKPSPAGTQESLSEENDFLDVLYREQMQAHIKTDELQVYLSTPIFPRSKIAKSGVLAWWKKHEAQYPNLSKMAKDYLSVGGSGVPAERFFSSGTDIVTDNRKRLTAQHVKELMCLKSWYKILEGDEKVEKSEK